MTNNCSSRRVSRRLAAVQGSATLAADARAKAMLAQGRPVISFGVGQPNFPTPDFVVRAAQEAAADPRNHGYSAGPGLPELRAAIAAKTKRDSGVVIDPENIVVTNGAKQANFEAWAAVLDPGDEVILPAPYWTTYPETIKFYGGLPVEVFAGPENGYKVTVEQLEAVTTPRTRALLLCTPNNPTGAVYSAAELREIGAWALRHDVWLVIDEIYEYLVYGDTTMAYMLAEVPEMQERTLIISGVSKSYAMTGWRLGWLYGPAEAMQAVRNYHSHLTGNVANVVQRAAIAALEGPRDEIENMRQAFDRRRLRLVELLRQIEGFEVIEPQGAFYVFVGVEAWLGRQLRGVTITSSQVLADLLLEHAEVALVPGEAFGAPGYLRFSYSLSDADLEEGCARITKLLRTAF
ncbi:Aspartate/methionine/tyrosine aminotransferase [Actinobaculum suis]|uniref:Aminotransferase n=1 Tax=Actinobaculum suis TaxID=1657 RepID=A0A1G7AXN1_9ACTO|nr:pyridoxal phosphate-dependent aminotransferase [Actinobaculum suis]MDY5153490.1 pyridoxal phosphate-dependent aminotransferase [Actinobaculum suis]SDE19654.1 Aspartate/methionine/tyrosine aminotransferase [Actinobaculum suis]